MALPLHSSELYGVRAEKKHKKCQVKEHVGGRFGVRYIFVSDPTMGSYLSTFLLRLATGAPQFLYGTLWSSNWRMAAETTELDMANRERPELTLLLLEVCWCYLVLVSVVVAVALGYGLA